MGPSHPSYTSVLPAHSAIDPFLGIFTGVFAYYLYENNPRTAPAQRECLMELVRWKREKTRQEEGERFKQDS